jgi:hypothetical protein
MFVHFVYYVYYVYYVQFVALTNRAQLVGQRCFLCFVVPVISENRVVLARVILATVILGNFFVNLKYAAVQ